MWINEIEFRRAEEKKISLSLARVAVCVLEILRTLMQPDIDRTGTLVPHWSVWARTRYCSHYVGHF